MSDKNFFCVLPWIHLQMSQDGTLQPCYLFKGKVADMSHGLLKAYHGKDFDDLRKSMQMGNIPPGCSACSRLESTGFPSLRTSSNLHHAEEVVRIQQSSGPKIMSLDLRFSNRCNYKCRICGPEGSTAWAEEVSSSRPGLVEATSNKSQLWKDLNALLPDVSRVSFAGGEPLLQEEQYQVLEKLIEYKNTQVKIFYSTNLSQFRFQQWSALHLWKQFPHLEIALSLDGVGAAGELLRSGMRWQHTLRQVELLQTEVPHAKLTILATLSVLNAFHLTTAIDTWVQLGWVNEAKDLILKPVSPGSQYELRVLKEDERRKLRLHFDEWLSKGHLPDPLVAHLESFLNDTFTDLEKQEHWKEGRNILRYSIVSLDKIRKEKTVKLFPEYLELIYGEE